MNSGCNDNLENEVSADDVEDAMPSSDDPSTKVVSFLAKLRGLGHLDDENLDEQLSNRRFELLQLRSEIGNDFESLLPSRLPSHREIHNEVLYGNTPKIHQMVAHVLYPEQVPWPTKTDELEEPLNESVVKLNSQAETLDDTKNVAQGGSSDSLREKSSRDGMRKSQNNLTKDEQLELDQKKEELTKGLVWLQRKRSAGGSTSRNKSLKSPRSDGLEVVVRGQFLSSTVKGYACVPVAEESALAASGVKDETRQERIEIEKEANLERFREKKLLDRIKELETAKENELKLQEEIAKKEEKRRQRNAHLKKKIEKSVQEKFKQEAEEAEQKKKDKLKQEEEEKKIKQYHETQKNKLADWWHDKNESEFMQVKLMEPKPKEKKRTPREVNQKQKEAEDNLRNLKWALEERPPLPPRAHDLKGPPLTDRDMKFTKQSVPTSWEMTAKTVSGAYGLSKKEYNVVTERTLACVNGAGRMAAYDL